MSGNGLQVYPGGDLGLYMRTVRRVAPTGVAATDVARRDAAVTAMAGVGEVYLTPGSHVWDTRLVLPNAAGLRFLGHPNAVVVATLTPGDTSSQAPFTAGATAIGATTTLAATTVLNARTISVTAIPGGLTTTTIVGKRIVYGLPASNVVTQTTVVAASGTGPYTLTLLDPVRWVWGTASSTCYVASVPQDIEIGGFQLTGTGDRGVELGRVWRAYVHDLVIGPDASGGVFQTCGLSFDNGSVDCVVERVRVDGNGSMTSFGIAAESALRVRGRDLVVRGVKGLSTGYGLVLECCRDFTFEASVHDCYNGVYIGSDGGLDPNACQNGRVDVSAIACTQDGMTIYDGCSDIEIGGRMLANGRYGLNASKGASLSPKRLRFTGLVSIGNGSDGVHLLDATQVVGGSLVCASNVNQDVSVDNTATLKLSSLVTSTTTVGVAVLATTAIADIDAWESDSHVTAHLYTVGRVRIGRHSAIDSGQLGVSNAVSQMNNAAAECTIERGDYTIANANSCYAVLCGNGAGGRFEGSVIARRTSGTAGAAFVAGASGTVVMKAGSRTTGAWANGCYTIDGTSIMRLSIGVDVSSATTKFGGTANGYIWQATTTGSAPAGGIV